MQNSFQLRKSNFLSFGLGFVGVLILLLLQAVNFHPINIIRPLFQVKSSPSVQLPFDERLNKIKNDYKIKKSVFAITQAHADSDINKASAYAGINYETGDVVISKDLDTRLPIASITKVMSAIVALDLASPQDDFQITKKAAYAIPTKIGVVEGQSMKLSELIEASLITSANDATQAIADGIDARYGKGTFVDAMNKKAAILGLKNSSFSNPQGFDNRRNFSTVEDLAILAHYALSNYPIISQTASHDYLQLPQNENHKQFDLYNWNGLLDVYPATIGLKIGNTGDAGYTTIVVSQRANHKMIAVVLGAPGILERDLWAAEVLDSSYLREYSLNPVSITKEMLADKYSTWKYWN